MIFLLAAFVIFFFLVLGSVAFLACVLVPPGRKYALSTALWFAAWGPCCVLFLFLTVLGLVAGGFALQATKMQWEAAPKLFSALGWGYAIALGVSGCAIASVVAWIHQALIHRLTFSLFRLYAAFVAAGIGSVFGWLALYFGMVSMPFPRVLLSAISMLILTTTFGAWGYKFARLLRGNAPTKLTWISPEEFAGPPNI